MIDHISFDVAQFEISKAFYKAALAPLGIGIIKEVPAQISGTTAYIGMGKAGRPIFWFGEGPKPRGAMHIAFTATNRAEVDAFYIAALEAGGTDNGAPGLRPEYHAHYYGAFVIDRDGHNLEAVCHMPDKRENSSA